MKHETGFHVGSMAAALLACVLSNGLVAVDAAVAADYPPVTDVVINNKLDDATAEITLTHRGKVSLGDEQTVRFPVVDAAEVIKPANHSIWIAGVGPHPDLQRRKVVETITGSPDQQQEFVEVFFDRPRSSEYDLTFVYTQSGASPWKTEYQLQFLAKQQTQLDRWITVENKTKVDWGTAANGFDLLLVEQEKAAAPRTPKVQLRAVRKLAAGKNSVEYRSKLPVDIDSDLLTIDLKRIATATSPALGREIRVTNGVTGGGPLLKGMMRLQGQPNFPPVAQLRQVDLPDIPFRVGSYKGCCGQSPCLNPVNTEWIPFGTDPDVELLRHHRGEEEPWLALGAKDDTIRYLNKKTWTVCLLNKGEALRVVEFRHSDAAWSVLAWDAPNPFPIHAPKPIEIKPGETRLVSVVAVSCTPATLAKDDFSGKPDDEKEKIRAALLNPDAVDRAPQEYVCLDTETAAVSGASELDPARFREKYRIYWEGKDDDPGLREEIIGIIGETEETPGVDPNVAAAKAKVDCLRREQQHLYSLANTLLQNGRVEPHWREIRDIRENLVCVERELAAAEDLLAKHEAAQQDVLFRQEQECVPCWLPAPELVAPPDNVYLYDEHAQPSPAPPRPPDLEGHDF